MRRLFVSLILLATPSLAEALDWESRIRTADGQPVAGATVSILGRTGEAITDADGRFTWQPAPAPPFEVLVILSDGTHTKPVTVTALDESITAAPLLTEAIVGRARRPASSPRPRPATPR
ncbi:MAG: carboxypeptidase regulatory-like domain-containing protein [Vicinamibacterales bacterium]